MNAFNGYMYGARLAQNIYHSQQIREFEGAAAKASGCSLYDLMERAGNAVFVALRQQWPMAQSILVVCGGGNNGGDGYVVARLAHEAGLKVAVVGQFDDNKASADAKLARQKWLACGQSEIALVDLDLAGIDVVVDALLGTGVCGVVRAEQHDVIAQINASQLPVISVDVPSGLDADSGKPCGIAINARSTVTFIGLKFGVVSGIGKHYAGQVIFNDLGVQPAFSHLCDSTTLAYHFSNLKPLASRPAHANKGNFGRLLCIGGYQGMPGAIRLCAEAALRTGAGLVKVLCHPQSQASVSIGRPEIMLADPESLDEHLRWATTIVIGPGLAQNPWAIALVEPVLAYQQQHGIPMVVDADALNILSKKSQQLNKNVVITPHPGEASRLLNTSVPEIEQQRLQSTQQLQQQFNCISLLKGAGTVIAGAQQHSAVCCDGNSGMATAGMGDVLSGIIGGLMAQGLSAEHSAVYGVALHAAAGDLCANNYGQRGLLASDMMPCIRKLINEHDLPTTPNK
ncbi:NAD(P)H-hydrate dehydratase [Alteromonadaceae bacterium BrNp21-10]|nr:NAD(P)H-hydrate dehydratase [Alteromonadaceae bacterium BrNp21-10]